MSQYKILPSQVLIVPGYTNEEIIAMSAKTQDTTASALKNGTSSEDKTKNKKVEASSSKSDTTPKNTDSSRKSLMMKKNLNRKASGKKNYLTSRQQSILNWTASTSNMLSSWWKKNTTSNAKNAPSNYMTSVDSSSAAHYQRLYHENIKKRNQEAARKKSQNNKATTTNTAKDKKQSATKSTGKTKVTKKTAKASKKEKKTSKKTASNKNNKKKKSKVNESSAATATESQVKIEKPKALLFSPNTVDYTAHRPDYEEFNSADGLILIEKACDQYAELQLTLSVHQAMRIQENGTLELSVDDKRSIDIITEGAPLTLDEETQLGHFLDPKDFTDSFVEIRRSFFDNYKNRPLTIISDLFPVISVCYITDLTYNINEGEEHAEYNITFREVANTWG